MPRPLIVALISAVLGTATIAPVANAQMRGASHSGFGRGVSASFSGRPHWHSFGPGAIFLGDPFYADYPVAPVTIPPQYVATQPMPIVDAPPEAKPEPLMIELQGNRYVRFGGRQSEQRGTNAVPDYAEAQENNSPRIAQSPPRPELPPAVLIFKDGHREQVSDYAIVGSTLYANGNYWQNGQWTNNIQVSALNVPATVSANRDNGVNFILPSAPNEVVTRP